MNPWAVLNFSSGWSVYGAQMKVDGAMKCVVVASTKVTTVHMDQTVSMQAFEDGEFLERGWKNSTITQRLEGDMQTGIGDTYAEAMIDLFGKWSPDQAPAEINGAQLELGAG